MLSELKRRKFKQFFDLTDRDKDGLLERDDFVAIARAAASMRGIDVGSPPYEALETVILLTWAHTQDFADANHNGTVTFDEWCKTLEATIESEEKYAIYATPFAVGLFEVLDTDSDGTVGPTEYEGFLKCFASDGLDARAIFARLDSNGDGLLTKAEALQLVREFLTSDEPNAPGNLLFGPY